MTLISHQQLLSESSRGLRFRQMLPITDALAVVLGMGPTALAIVRGLGRKGVEVYGIGLSNSEISFTSRYCTKLCAIDPRHNPDLLCERLVEFAEKHHAKKKVIYPSGDECVAFISQYDRILREHYLYSDLSRQTAESFLSKKEFYNLCLDSQVPAPRAFFPDNLKAALSLQNCVPYPCLLKPIYYHLWAEEFGLQKGFVCRDKTEYTRNLYRVRHVIENIMIQEIIEGPEDRLRMLIAYIDHRGNAHGIFTGRKIRQFPPGFGTGSAFLSSFEPEIIEPSLRLLKTSQYHGMIEIEYKWCQTEQEYKVIEANIRPCRLGGLVEASGVDPLYASFLDLSGHNLTGSYRQKYGVRWFFPARDIPAIIDGLLNRRFSFPDVVRSYKRPRTWCIWDRDDPTPFFAYFREMMSKGMLALKRRNSGQ